MNPSLATSIAGESIRLWPDRALHWPAGRTLFIADPHFGKAATFRAFGIAAPDPTETDLQRLSGLLRATEAQRLVILGDFFHARPGVSPATMSALSAWRARHGPIAITLVRGNHDVRAGDPPASLDIEVVTEPWGFGPWFCRHTPAAQAGGHVLAGHLHPAVSLREKNGATLRLACFVVGPSVSILPAFGSFTGLDPVPRVAGERLFAVTEKDVIAL